MKKEGKLHGSEIYSIRPVSSGSPFLSARQGLGGWEPRKIPVAPASHASSHQEKVTSPGAHTAQSTQTFQHILPATHPREQQGGDTGNVAGDWVTVPGRGACPSVPTCWSATKAQDLKIFKGSVTWDLPVMSTALTQHPRKPRGLCRDFSWARPTQ